MDHLLPRRIGFDGRLARIARGILAAVRGARERARQRRALAALSDDLLRDIGLDRGDRAREAGKPAWRP